MLQNAKSSSKSQSSLSIHVIEDLTALNPCYTCHSTSHLSLTLGTKVVNQIQSFDIDLELDVSLDKGLMSVSNIFLDRQLKGEEGGGAGFSCRYVVINLFKSDKHSSGQINKRFIFKSVFLPLKCADKTYFGVRASKAYQIFAI